MSRPAPGFASTCLTVDLSTGNEVILAGAGTRGYSGDGGPATGTELNLPSGLHDRGGPAVDPAGNVSDAGNHRIRRIDAGGIITTVAGNGSDGDGGPAVAAALRAPCDLVFDAAGNLLAADRDAGTVRRIAPDGTLATIPGATGSPCGPTAPFWSRRPGGSIRKPGDNLWSIAHAQGPRAPATAWNDADIARYWHRLITDNRDRIRSGRPGLIYPGEVLELPPTTTTPTG
ncbi:hypothetical protein [Jidongwangia harbinensis]|uniref:hypothetical protein n=1 Tax=Jidongwangia harbinensis TaxID=2878561 RepID=UPI001CD942F2|nr:hypothetical protein [Jidongwangia harbinensis]MCA2216264.1 hypothetical protein [Jidongwangia harbinensis]MCA2216999.1 hypothetical protein [Jidongwangia harbinensis]